MFAEYQHVTREMAKVDFASRYPYRIPDTNVGGGHAAMRNDDEQKLLERIEANPRMIYLERLKKTCAAAVSHMTETQIEVYRTRYESPDMYTWPELENVLHYSHMTVYRKRYSILYLLAKELGWC